MAEKYFTKVCPQCLREFTRKYDRPHCSARCGAQARWGDAATRFWSHVDKRGPNECWLWTASKFWNGYGQYFFRGKQRKAMQVAWILTHGEIPEGEGFHGTCVCHHCDVRLCCNPTHLFLAPHKKNMADKVAKQRQARGSSHGNSKLTEKDVLEIRASAWTTREVMEKFGISSANVSFIRSRVSWKHI